MVAEKSPVAEGNEIPVQLTTVPDPEVPERVERPRRRHFTVGYKLRILSEADAARTPGEIGALLRREGLDSSHLAGWRRQREQGILQALTPRRRGDAAGRRTRPSSGRWLGCARRTSGWPRSWPRPRR